ncbi:MAG: prepilin-type N-terminal cleavage/methylation domain-containing protein [Gemmatimonadaceae bacterium]
MRRGVTLLELLVVLVLMAIAAALVLPAIRFPRADVLQGDENIGTTGDANASALMQSPEVDGVLTQARRLAIKRGEPVRLRVATDGVWAIVSANSGKAIESGRVAEALSWQPDLTVDAVGTCMLQPTVVPRSNATAWDALACRWRRSAS